MLVAAFHNTDKVPIIIGIESNTFHRDGLEMIVGQMGLQFAVIPKGCRTMFTNIATKQVENKYKKRNGV